MEYYFIYKDISLETHSKMMGITIQGLGNGSNFSGHIILTLILIGHIYP